MRPDRGRDRGACLGEAIRAAEVLGALSLAADLGAGQPAETSLSATVLAVRLGRALGLREADLADIFYASVTRFVGCSATGPEASVLALGEDATLNYSLSRCDWTDPDQVEAALQAHFALHLPDAERRKAFRALRENHAGIPALAALHCQQAQVLVARLGLPPGAVALLGHMYDRWDGRIPGAHGPGIPAGARIISLAASTDLICRAEGAAAAVEVARLRSGGQFDPELCLLLAREAPRLLAPSGDASSWEAFLDAEPGSPLHLDPGRLGSVAEVFADFVDQKSAWLIGHSRRVASLAFRGARAAGLGADECEALRCAALVHDIGRAAVPNRVWDRPGPLSAMDLRQAQSHSSHSETVLSAAPAFGPIREAASSVHERCDSSGYHRRSPLVDLKCGLLAAADVYEALTHDRPWRGALSGSAASDTLLGEVSAGRLPREATRAILEAAGHAKRTVDRVYPAGLTRRESEVLARVARGLSTKQIAVGLDISVKTADHHIQSVYEKTGARGRAAAAVYALEHGIFLE